ncbi:hypothetical protein HNQ07_004745 [Deinococcus metalli]|uniref:SRPBCC family protein n=1 Tax=Deinococcus metalli TaxID=1141878 RepID=A0A7W8KJS6_9DEIO|nr:SRPBCC family protein [Deinococcus metalli]MBB5379230.1 hypothetical protein [Deinococcus metalli]GHF65573.1 hypothetical protein GCM10017781_46610 [Deinococcus metalli]
MQLLRTVQIGVPATAAWALLGERFGEITAWASVIMASTLDGPPRPGAVRTCHTARFGPVPPGEVRERLLVFDPAALTLTYEALSGLPAFITHAVNRWTVTPTGPATCTVTTDATLTLRGPARLLAGPLAVRLEWDAGRVLDELRHSLEHHEPHPRTRAARHAEAQRGPGHARI